MMDKMFDVQFLRDSLMFSFYLIGNQLLNGLKKQNLSANSVG